MKCAPLAGRQTNGRVRSRRCRSRTGSRRRQSCRSGSPVVTLVLGDAQQWRVGRVDDGEGEDAARRQAAAVRHRAGDRGRAEQQDRASHRAAGGRRIRVILDVGGAEAQPWAEPPPCIALDRADAGRRRADRAFHDREDDDALVVRPPLSVTEQLRSSGQAAGPASHRDAAGRGRTSSASVAPVRPSRPSNRRSCRLDGSTATVGRSGTAACCDDVEDDVDRGAVLTALASFTPKGKIER